MLKQREASAIKKAEQRKNADKLALSDSDKNKGKVGGGSKKKR